MYLNHGVCGEVINTPDCDSGMRGFNSPQTPHSIANSFTSWNCFFVSSKQKEDLDVFFYLSSYFLLFKFRFRI